MLDEMFELIVETAVCYNCDHFDYNELAKSCVCEYRKGISPHWLNDGNGSCDYNTVVIKAKDILKCKL